MIITIRNASYRLYNKEKKHFYNDIHEEMRDIPSADEFNDYNVADLSKAISELEKNTKSQLHIFIITDTMPMKPPNLWEFHGTLYINI